ncbi:MAG: hypothetical protein LBF86_05320 [Helicobacteraceae bacterium]|jgi:hypothetical protein|nr:hypothetical protein [Helicobacteraceae bacterium]
MPENNQDAVSGMEQVRNLLFGAQVQQIEERIKKLEDFFVSRIDALKSEIVESLQRQERLFHSKIQEESSRRSEDKNFIESKEERLSEELKSSLEALSESFSTAQSEMSARLLCALNDRHNDALRALNDLAVLLRRELVAKTALAKAFAELADGEANEIGVCASDEK